MEQEVISLMNCDDYYIAKEIKDAYGLNEESEELLEKNLLLSNPFDINIKFPRSKSKPLKIGYELLYGLGVEMYESDNTVEHPKEIISEKRKELMRLEEEKKNKSPKKKSNKKQ